jgi:seryl-tRNA synthetase
VAEFRPGSPDQAEFLAELLDAGLLIDSGVSGVYGRGEGFERVRWAFDALVSEAAETDDPERLAFPPLLPRKQLEEIGYLKSFPHLAGSIFSFEGDEEQAAEQEERASRHEDWSEHQEMTDLVLTPAACYPVYPAVAARGKLSPGGTTVDAGGSYVFRHEPSGDPARLQMFHQREIVRIGEPDTVAEWRDAWRDRAVELLRSVGLDARFDVASDPFFGRSGRLLARSQRAQELKFEILVQIAGPEPTAVASFNYHQDHFSSTYGIEMEGEEGTAHTACLGFGLERITLALLREHGLDVDGWPAAVREEMRLT